MRREHNNKETLSVSLEWKKQHPQHLLNRIYFNEELIANRAPFECRLFFSHVMVRFVGRYYLILQRHSKKRQKCSFILHKFFFVEFNKFTICKTINRLIHIVKMVNWFFSCAKQTITNGTIQTLNSVEFCCLFFPRINNKRISKNWIKNIIIISI